MGDYSDRLKAKHHVDDEDTVLYTTYSISNLDDITKCAEVKKVIDIIQQGISNLNEQSKQLFDDKTTEIKLHQTAKDQLNLTNRNLEQIKNESKEIKVQYELNEKIKSQELL